MFIYTKSKQEENCAVCLDEFEDNDRIRTLPLCSHTFHLVCIDTWLSKQPNCPICRSCLRCAQFDQSPLKPIMANRIRPSFHHDHMPYQNDDENHVNGYYFPRFYSFRSESSSSLKSPPTPYPHYGLRVGTSVSGQERWFPREVKDESLLIFSRYDSGSGT